MKVLESSLSRFLESQNDQPEAGLIILETTDLTDLLPLLASHDYHVTSNWETALTLLGHGQCVALRVPRGTTRETYDIISQFRARLGTVQIFDKRSGEWKCATCDPCRTHLILLVTHDDLPALCSRYDLLNKVGITERL